MGGDDSQKLLPWRGIHSSPGRKPPARAHRARRSHSHDRAYGLRSIDQAISIVHDLKAFWFLEKPVQPGVMRALLERAIQQSRLVEETERLSRQLSYQGVLGDMVGDSPAMKEVFSWIRQVAPTTASVLITGESGTGKELVARAIHRLSPRSGGPFVAVNCAALPESLVESELFGHEKGAFTGAAARRVGCFEQAQNGTLLLDEIGEMPHCHASQAAARDRGVERPPVGRRE
jgi:DNA-binding NtrC family response regulator